MKRSLLVLLALLWAPPSLGAQNVLVVYYSMTGHTRVMAHAVADGAGSVPGAEVRLMTVEEASAADLLWADAIILGSPVHNASPAAAVLEFTTTWPFDGQPLKDKVGAAFVTGGGISAGEEAAQLAILRAMLIYNMIVVGGPDWQSAFGASAITLEEPFAPAEQAAPDGPLLDPLFVAKGTALGRRVAEVARRVTRGGPDS